MAKFKEGDKVVLVRTIFGMLAGNRGTVEHIDACDGMFPYCVAWEGCGHDWVMEDELELVEEDK